MATGCREDDDGCGGRSLVLTFEGVKTSGRQFFDNFIEGFVDNSASSYLRPLLSSFVGKMFRMYEE